MKRSKKIYFLILALVFAMSVLMAGCGSKPAEQAQKSTADATTSEATKEEAKPLEPVELIYYFGGGQQKDLQAVNDEFNKLLKEKINATVKLNLIDWGGYEQKMNVVIASGEPYDLCFTATWMNNYFQNVAKGTYLPIDELLDKYAPNTKANIPEKVWSAARVNGKIYGVINWQIMAASYGIGVQRDLADKYQFDYKSVTKYQDLEPFLAAVKKGEPDKIPFEYSNTNDIFTGAPPVYGMDAIGDLKAPGWVYMKDENKKVINQYDTPEFKDLINTTRKWYQAGYLRKDAATTKEITADRKIAKYAAVFPQGIANDTIEAPKSNGSLFSVTNVKWYDKKLIPNLITTDRAAATLTAISKNSKNPERAMMLLELMNSDKKVYNTLNWGIEGKHYSIVSESEKITKIKLVPDSGYNPQIPWEFGNNENLYIPDTEGDDFIDSWVKLNRSSDVSPLLGFTFNTEAVKSEIAQSQSVIDEYLSGLTTGSVDPEKYHPEFIEKLKKAGSEKIIAEKQKQIDAWVAANK